MDQIQIFEVSPRDGLQNEATVVPTATKAELILRLADAGVRDIEVTSFVRPRWIPQLADAAELVAQLPARDGVRYWGLIPNRVGLDRAYEGGIRHIATFLSASETHNKKNLNRTVRESLANVQEVILAAKDEQMGVRAYISTVFGCPYEGEVAVESTIRLALPLLEAGTDVIALGDTTGMANPAQVTRILGRLVTSGVPLSRIAVHFHDTRGTALANALAAWQFGVRMFDGSVAGLGGCPYAPGASGNAATEDLVHMFQAMGVPSGVDLGRLANAGVWLEAVLGRELPGRFHQFWRGSEELATAQGRTA